MIRLVTLAAVALTLSACVSLFPKSKPVQLYRLDPPTASAEPPSTVRPVGVLKANGSFVRAAAGDRLLTVTGERSAFIAEARWESPASVLFEEAVMKAFDANSGPVRLVGRGDPAKAAYVLRLDVRDFHTAYEAGPDAAPKVLVRVRGELVNGQTREVAGEKVFEVLVPASENRVSAIVRAYADAVAQVLEMVVNWTNEVTAEG